MLKFFKFKNLLGKLAIASIMIFGMNSAVSLNSAVFADATVLEASPDELKNVIIEFVEHTISKMADVNNTDKPLKTSFEFNWRNLNIKMSVEKQKQADSTN